MGSDHTKRRPTPFEVSPEEAGVEFIFEDFEDAMCQLRKMRKEAADERMANSFEERLAILREKGAREFVFMEVEDEGTPGQIDSYLNWHFQGEEMDVMRAGTLEECLDELLWLAEFYVDDKTAPPERDED